MTNKLRLFFLVGFCTLLQPLRLAFGATEDAGGFNVTVILARDEYRMLCRELLFAPPSLVFEAPNGERSRNDVPFTTGPDIGNWYKDPLVRFRFTNVPAGRYLIQFLLPDHVTYGIPVLSYRRVEIQKDEIIVCDIPALIPMRVRVPSAQLARKKSKFIYMGTFVEFWDLEFDHRAENVLINEEGLGEFLIGVTGRKYRARVLHGLGESARKIAEIEFVLTPELIEKGEIRFVEDPTSKQ